MAINILIADDHSLIRELFAAVLEVQFPGGCVDQAESLASVQERLESEIDYDILLLDLQMPGMEGIDSAVQLARNYPQSRIIIVTGTEESALALHALRRGLAGFVPKSLGVEAAVNAIRLVISGERYIPSVALDGIMQGANGMKTLPSRNLSPRISANDVADTKDACDASDECDNEDLCFEDLTDRENAVLLAITKGKSNKEIARELDIAEITVKIHAQGVFRKLGVRNRTQAAAAFLSKR